MGSIIKGLQVNALLLHTLLEALDQNIISIAILAIHADPYAMFAQHTCKGLTGELTALSVLKMSGLLWRAKASSNASTQKSASSVFD